MSMYESFARVYDTFMDNVPYGEWADTLETLLKMDGIQEGLLLDLGCGTGNLTRLFALRGYDMIGVDGSADMLEVALEKELPEKGRILENGSRRADILYLNQDMQEFELFGTVRAVLSTCDSLNYITDPNDLLKVFRLVNNYLDPGGLFLFDLSTVYDYEKLCADNTFAENRGEGSFIWENHYDPDTCLNEYDLTLFIRQEGGLFRRCSETHLERAYTLETVKGLLAGAGLVFLNAYDGYSLNPLREDSERMLIAAREHGKAQL